MNTILEAKDLRKYFKVGKDKYLHAVDDVSFTVEEGHTLGVVGESGCGKSTLGRTLLHLLENDGGQIFFEGEDITKVDRKKLSELRNKMQMIFQDPYASLNPRMTVSEIIAEPLVLHGNLSKAEIEAKVNELMETVGLAKRLYNAYPHELDGGRRQRIGIARALALNPRFIVCDEPVSALDVSIQAQILNLMQDLQKKTNLTYIFITHNLSVVKYISHEIMVMYLGQAVEKAESDELFLHPYHPYTQALLSAIPIPDPHRNVDRILIKGEITSPINPKPGCRFAARCPYVCDRCYEKQTLREIVPNHFVSCCRAEEINNNI